MFVHFTTYNSKHSSPKNRKCSIRTNVYLFLLGLKMQMKLCFMVLGILYLGFGQVLELLLKEFVRSLCM